MSRICQQKMLIDMLKFMWRFSNIRTFSSYHFLTEMLVQTKYSVTKYFSMKPAPFYTKLQTHQFDNRVQITAHKSAAISKQSQSVQRNIHRNFFFAPFANCAIVPPAHHSIFNIEYNICLSHAQKPFHARMYSMLFVRIVYYCSNYASAHTQHPPRIQ